MTWCFAVGRRSRAHPVGLFARCSGAALTTTTRHHRITGPRPPQALQQPCTPEMLLPCPPTHPHSCAALGHACPEHYNPAEFVADLISIDYSTSRWGVWGFREGLGGSYGSCHSTLKLIWACALIQVLKAPPPLFDCILKPGTAVRVMRQGRGPGHWRRPTHGHPLHPCAHTLALMHIPAQLAPPQL